MIVVHGGPGAAGSMAPVAREIADSYRVLEPFQSPTSDTVARHIADLHHVVESRGGGARPAIVGHSWGAMLALAYAAAHPTGVGPLVLVGCGTFDLPARARLRENLNARADVETRRRFANLENEFPDPEQRFRELGKLTLALYSYSLATTETGSENVDDAAASAATWNDMVRLQETGVYPGAFVAIESPVLMIHGDVDPHPGAMTRATLQPCLPQLEYRELERCGHYPWLEKFARDEFFSLLREWLAVHHREIDAA